MELHCVKGKNPKWEKILNFCVKQNGHRGCKNLIAGGGNGNKNRKNKKKNKQCRKFY